MLKSDMLYIMRHGKTDWNAEHRLQGHTDIPLNDEGRKMAQRAAEEYKDVHFDVCFCSPLIRAKETAQILLSGRNVPIEIDERLIEMSFGVFEGAAHVFKLPDCPIKNLFLHPEKYTVPVEGGERFEDVFARTNAFMNEKIEPLLQQGKDVLIVGHGALNSCIVAQIKKLPIEKLWSENMENCKLMRLR